MKTETGMVKVVLLACAALAMSATLALGAAAVAGETIVRQTETVKYSRSEAATPAGAVKLYGTLREAADVQVDAFTAVYHQDSRSRAKPGIVTVAKR